MSRFLPGQVVSDKFRVVSVLGEGAMGTVYAVEHLTLRASIALKVLSPHLARRPEQVERFLREGAAISRVRHRAVVQVYDAGQHDGQPWIAMELLQGETLRARLSRGGLGAKDAVTIMIEIVQGLAASHAQGIIHRDVKPTNISLALQADGSVQPKLLDFGVALVQDAQERLTGAGMTMGTLHYMAPEQVHASRDVDARADLYAVGAILFEALAGRPPYAANSVHELVAALATRAQPDLAAAAPHQPKVLAEIVNRCLAKNRDERPTDARQLALMLETAHRFADQQAGAMPSTLVIPGIADSRPGAVDPMARTALQADPSQASQHGSWAQPQPSAAGWSPPGAAGPWQQQPSMPGSHPGVAAWSAQPSSAPAWQASPAPQGSWAGASQAQPWAQGPSHVSHPAHSHPSHAGYAPSDPFAQQPKSSGLWHLAWIAPLGLVLMGASAFAVVKVLEDDDDDESSRVSDTVQTVVASQAPVEPAPPPPTDPGSVMMPLEPRSASAPVAPPQPAPVAAAPPPQYPTLVPTPVPTQRRHPCVGEWSGPLLQSDGQRASGTVDIESTGGSCGGFVERWQSGSVCHYRLSNCETSGSTLTASARTPARERCSPVRMRFTCEGGRLRFFESAPNVTVSSLMSRR